MIGRLLSAGLALTVTTCLVAGCSGEDARAAAALTGTSAASASSADPGSAAADPGATAALTATAALVTGFPARTVPVPPGARITTSTVQARGDLVEVSLAGTTRQPAAAVVAFYTKALTRQGFTATKGTLLPPGVTGRAFGRQGGRELLVVAVFDTGPVRSFSVGGTVAT